MTAPRGSDFEGTVAITGDSKIEQCRLCSHGLTDPLFLPCFHTFCASCIQNAISSSVDHEKFLCPLCKSVFCKPTDGAKGFPENIYARAEGRASKPSDCQVCEEKQAKQRCLECEELYCSECSTAHLKMKASRNHHLTDIQPGDAKCMKPRLCPKHKTEDLGFYCTDCEIPICFKCNMTVHKSHDCEDLDHKAASVREKLREEIKQICADRENIYRTRIETMKTSKAKLGKDLEDCKQEILNRVKTIQDQVEAYAQKQVENLEIAVKRQSSVIENRITEQEKKLESLNLQLSEMSRYLLNACSADVIDKHKDVTNILGEYRNDCHLWLEEVISIEKAAPNDELSQMTLRNLCGEAEMLKSTKSSVRLKKVKQINVDMKEVNAILPLTNGEALFSSFNKKGTSVWKVKGDGSISHVLHTNDDVSKIMKDVYGNVYVQACSSLTKLGQRNESNENIVLPEQSGVFDITADNVLYMCSERGVIYTYDWDKRLFLRVFQNSELRKRHFGAMTLTKSCTVCITNVNKVLVCESNFCSKKTVAKENSTFCDIVTADDGHVYASDAENNCIHLLAGDGTYLQQISSVEDCFICGDIAIDQIGQFWIGCQGKIAIFQVKDK